VRPQKSKSYVPEAEAQVALVVPGEAEELRRDQAVFAEADALCLCIQRAAEAGFGAGDVDRAQRGIESRPGLSQRRRSGQRLCFERVQLRIVVALPPVGVGPAAGNVGSDAGEWRLVAQGGTIGARGNRAGSEQHGAGEGGEPVAHGSDLPDSRCGAKARTRWRVGQLAGSWACVRRGRRRAQNNTSEF